MSLFPCNHSFGTVQTDGYQYCKKCGLAVPVPCQHQWAKMSQWGTESRLTGNMYKIQLLYECRKCGETKIVEVR